ncbi:MAG: ATP-binding protein, partial [Phycisphaerales bacterium]
VSAVVRFTWRNPRTAQRERGIFKVLKPHIPGCFAEDRLLHHSTTVNIRGESYRLKDRRRAGLLARSEEEGRASPADFAVASASATPEATAKHG